MKRATVIVLSMFCLVLLSACGGGSGGDGGGGTPPATGNSNWDQMVWDRDDWG